jgi:phage-related protein
MSGKGLIFGLVGAGVVIAIVLGLLGQSQTRAEKQFCNSLGSLQTSVQTLTSLSAGTANEGDVQSAVSGVQSAWGDVKNDAQDLSNVNMRALDGSWEDFTSAVRNIPSSASVDDAVQGVSSAVKGLQSTVQSNLKTYDCSNNT